MKRDYFVKKFIKYCTVESRKYLIGVDFDGTMAKSLFPVSSDPGPEMQVNIMNLVLRDCVSQRLPTEGIFKDFDYVVPVTEIMRHWGRKGDRFILWTCRTKQLYENIDALQDAVDWSAEHGIKFVAVNKNHPGVTDNPRKILADRIIDDNSVDVEKPLTWTQHKWNIERTVLSVLESGQYHKIMPNPKKSS